MACPQKINTEFLDNPANRQRFVDFFIHNEGLTHILNLMNLYDILGRYLPAWGKIVGLMQYDHFHIFPVDEHILVVIRNLRRMAMDIHSHELPLPSALMQSFPKNTSFIWQHFFTILPKVEMAAMLIWP